MGLRRIILAMLAVGSVLLVGCVPPPSNEAATCCGAPAPGTVNVRLGGQVDSEVGVRNH